MIFAPRPIQLRCELVRCLIQAGNNSENLISLYIKRKRNRFICRRVESGNKKKTNYVEIQFDMQL